MTTRFATSESPGSLGPNDSIPCPSESCRRTAMAHGRICPVCEPDEEYPARCPVCLDMVTAAGRVVQRHEIEGVDMVCPGSGAAFDPPSRTRQPIVSAARPAPVKPHRALALVGSDGAA